MLQFVLGLIAVGLFGLVVYLVVKQRVFAPFTVSQHTIEPGTLIYTTYRGDYHQIMGDVTVVKSDLNAFLATGAERWQKEGGGSSGGDDGDEDERKDPLRPATGRSSDDLCMVGVYYDIPHTLKDTKQARALLGAIIRDSDNFDISAFLKLKGKQRTYQTIKLGRLQAFGADFPLLGVPSLLSAVVRGYPAIRQWAMENGSGLLERTVCALETYQWAKGHFNISFVYGKNAESLIGLSKYPQPALKAGLSPVKTVKKTQ